LQGEQAVMNLAVKHFSVISLRKGTISGYSSRMRLDLIINTMFKCAVRDGVITINNPSIWRPILSIDDAANAYIRAIEASESITGIFNIASANYTVGEVGDLVRDAVEGLLGIKVQLSIKHIQDYRNYKVNTDKAANVLSFHPNHEIKNIVANLVENIKNFEDWPYPSYYNIQTLKALETHSGAVSAVAGVSH
jgi:nucleoside-diphosphate-sugar epimerase